MHRCCQALGALGFAHLERDSGIALPIVSGLVLVGTRCQSLSLGIGKHLICIDGNVAVGRPMVVLHRLVIYHF